MISQNFQAVLRDFPDVAVRLMNLAAVSSHGDPDTIFFNVNRPEDHLRADELLAELRAAESGPGRGAWSAEEG